MMVEDMADGVLDMYGRGYAMLGYSQFVSPLLTSLAPSYATKYAAAMNAAYVVLETPRPGSSNLHGYLATYWAMVRPELSTFGSYIQNLPEDMLKRLGENYNRVMLRQIIPGTPAAGAGFKANDIVLAVNGVRVVSTDVFSKMLNENQGKEVLISIPRQGELLELPVILTVPVQVSNAGYGFYEAPWRNTEPTDWSSLSAANITVDVLRQQQAECKCQAAYERGRLAVMGSGRAWIPAVLFTTAVAGCHDRRVRAATAAGIRERCGNAGSHRPRHSSTGRNTVSFSWITMD